MPSPPLKLTSSLGTAADHREIDHAPQKEEKSRGMCERGLKGKEITTTEENVCVVYPILITVDPRVKFGRFELLFFLCYILHMGSFFYNTKKLQILWANLNKLLNCDTQNNGEQ